MMRTRTFSNDWQPVLTSRLTSLPRTSVLRLLTRVDFCRRLTMSDETYYTVLNVAETASAVEIKMAYRDLIKQVHPDTITNLAPYLRKIAEDKAKEITEAYTVLSNASKRRDYDRQLAAYRHQNAPQ